MVVVVVVLLEAVEVPAVCPVVCASVLVCLCVCAVSDWLVLMVRSEESCCIEFNFACMAMLMVVHVSVCM